MTGSTTTRNFPAIQRRTHSKICAINLPLAVWGNVAFFCAATVPTSEDWMEQRAPGSSSAANSPAAKTSHRNVWVVTAYAITGLAVFAVLAYYLSNYLAR